MIAHKVFKNELKRLYNEELKNDTHLKDPENDSDNESDHINLDSSIDSHNSDDNS